MIYGNYSLVICVISGLGVVIPPQSPPTLFDTIIKKEK